MLLDEDPATLIHHTIGNFNIFPDKHAVARINDTLQTLRTSRDYQVREAETALKKLSRSQATLSSHHAETLSSHSSTAHASTIATLDTQKFRIAKNASDLEIETERLSSQLADLQAKLAELEIQGVDGYDSNSVGTSVGPAASRGASVEDEVLLRLAVYRSLGMTVERDEATGEYGKVVVSNGKKGDVHVVNLDGKFSKFFYSNYFWGVL